MKTKLGVYHPHPRPNLKTLHGKESLKMIVLGSELKLILSQEQFSFLLVPNTFAKLKPNHLLDLSLNSRVW